MDPLAIKLGVEEEFFLIDPETRDLLSDPDRGIFEECERNCGPHEVVAEFLRSQIETTTRVCAFVAEVRSALNETRRLVIDAAAKHGAAVLAASTHPFAAWANQVVTAGHSVTSSSPRPTSRRSGSCSSAGCTFTPGSATSTAACGS